MDITMIINIVTRDNQPLVNLFFHIFFPKNIIN